MLLAKLRSAAAAALFVGVAAAGTGVLARHLPTDPPRGAATGPRPDAPLPATGRLVARSGEGGDESPPDVQAEAAARGPSVQELEVRLRAARRLLGLRENLGKRAGVSTQVVEEARNSVHILEARLEAQRENLHDELERLEARYRVKQAEQGLVKARLRLAIDGQRGKELIEAELAVKDAEADEIQVRIKQVRRRLGRAEASAGDPKAPIPAQPK